MEFIHRDYLEVSFAVDFEGPALLEMRVSESNW